LLRFAEEIAMASTEVFRFADFTLDVTERRLLHRAAVVRLSPKAFDVLVVLVRERGRLVRKDELLQRVWPESFVEEGSLTVHVSALSVVDARYVPSVSVPLTSASGTVVTPWVTPESLAHTLLAAVPT